MEIVRLHSADPQLVVSTSVVAASKEIAIALLDQAFHKNGNMRDSAAEECVAAIKADWAMLPR